MSNAFIPEPKERVSAKPTSSFKSLFFPLDPRPIYSFVRYLWERVSVTMNRRKNFTNVISDARMHVFSSSLFRVAFSYLFFLFLSLSLSFCLSIFSSQVQLPCLVSLASQREETVARRSITTRILHGKQLEISAKRKSLSYRYNSAWKCKNYLIKSTVSWWLADIRMNSLIRFAWIDRCPAAAPMRVVRGFDHPHRIIGKCRGESAILTLQSVPSFFLPRDADFRTCHPRFCIADRTFNREKRGESKMMLEKWNYSENRRNNRNDMNYEMSIKSRGRWSIQMSRSKSRSASRRLRISDKIDAWRPVDASNDDIPTTKQSRLFNCTNKRFTRISDKPRLYRLARRRMHGRSTDLESLPPSKPSTVLSRVNRELKVKFAEALSMEEEISQHRRGFAIGPVRGHLRCVTSHHFFSRFYKVASYHGFDEFINSFRRLKISLSPALTMFFDYCYCLTTFDESSTTFVHWRSSRRSLRRSENASRFVGNFVISRDISRF